MRENMDKKKAIKAFLEWSWALIFILSEVPEGTGLMFWEQC